MRLERKIKDQEEIQGIGRRGAVASGNYGFLFGYKLAVQFKFGDSSLYYLYKLFKNFIRKASRKGKIHS